MAQQLPAGTNLGLDKRSRSEGKSPNRGERRDPSKRLLRQNRGSGFGPKEPRTTKLTRKSPAVVKTILYNNLLVNIILPSLVSLVNTVRSLHSSCLSCTTIVLVINAGVQADCRSFCHHYRYGFKLIRNARLNHTVLRCRQFIVVGSPNWYSVF